MKRGHWLVLALGLILVGLGLMPDGDRSARVLRLPEALPGSQRQTVSGPIIGGRAPSGAQVWLGIPYAAAPTGERRWRAPRPPAPWSEARPALRYGPVCPQFASPLSSIDAASGALIGDEDCLSLNVFAPAGADAGAGLPVMVFIHGGGNSIGSARPYDGSRFVQEQGVLMVTLNYRLGPLGWFSHAALRETAANPEEASGNFALLDLCLALAWVRDNIAAFGGDPQRVTLFGESAGGRNIYGLLASPLARGLFHGAIIQSGAAGSFSPARAESRADAVQPGHRNSSGELLLAWLEGSGLAERRAAALRNLEQLGGEEILAFMRGLDIETLLAPLATPGGMYRLPTLFRDGTVLPEEPLLEVFADPERWNRVPVIAGSNRDEMKLFLALDDEHVRRRFGLFPAPRDPERYARLAHYHSRQWRAVGVDEPLARMSRSDPQLPLYSYRLDWDAMRADALLDLPRLLGAAHGLELDFLFGPLLARVVPGIITDDNREGFEALGRTMRDYWAGFAYTGAPATGRSGVRSPWPLWSERRPRVMLLDEPGGGGLRSLAFSLRVADVKAELARDESLPERLRCALYVDMFLANGGLEQLFDPAEYRDLGCAQFRSGSLEGLSR